MAVAAQLVKRNICTWIEYEQVISFRGTKVLNGLFGVAKSTLLPDTRPVLRVIMNLIPSNAVLRQLHGCVQELPSVTQYLSLILEDGEQLSLCQSDMTSAFYLFSLPPQWSRFLAFNLMADGAEIGKTAGIQYCLSCGVLPMGWSSAVPVMQEISQNLLLRGGLPLDQRVDRTRPLPNWLTEVLEGSRSTSRAWYHVYLDNFFAGERVRQGEEGDDAAELHRKAETCWNDAGVLSSEKKRISKAREVQELGAEIDGIGGLLGVSAERLVRLIQSTAFILSKAQVPKKWLQVVSGRWVHVLQFRRAGMSSLHLVWRWISGKKLGVKGQLAARRELLMLCLGSCLLHTHLGAAMSGTCTASDASGKGGAVGKATELSDEGKEFCAALLRQPSSGCRAPILVLSLFNGIGGAFRAYDLIGVEPMGLISYEISKHANRVVGRRWPHAMLKGDVRGISRKEVFSWLLLFPHVMELHLWGGFPCVDLSAVKFGRKNLEGSESGLFREILKVLELPRQVFGRTFKILFFIENVASMDKSAQKEIDAALGVRPYKVQCADAVPISRPRFCWTNHALGLLPGVKVVDKGDYLEISAVNEYPLEQTWLTEGCSWPSSGSGVVFPTCMKAIKRLQPPPRPAGLDRTPQPARDRWAADDFKYPPYQYKDQYVIWRGNSWRLIDSSERELLHGYGWGHTSVCMSASDIKKDVQAYEDLRCSLVGDSFSLYSFAIFAWSACASLLPGMTYAHLCSRMGMAPGFCAPSSSSCPLARRLVYANDMCTKGDVSSLGRLLLTRVNHTGSDIGISTGAVMNPKAFPRQSACASWWCWKHVFHCRWQKSEHINRLEMRSILLALRWRIQHLTESSCRFIHLTDSYISMSVISKGRSSSEALMSIMRKLAAVQFSFNLYPILIHVESTENPTDEASRF